jgi:hypothetical protein
LPYRRGEDLLPGEQIAGQPVELDLAVDEGRLGHDLTVDERIGHEPPLRDFT